jgi:hypothetical protein
MSSRTRPFIPPRLAAEPRANRIKLNIFHRQPEMPLIQRTGIEPSLPKVAAPAVKTVDILRVAKMGPAGRQPERRSGPGAWAVSLRHRLLLLPCFWLKAINPRGPGTESPEARLNYCATGRLVTVNIDLVALRMLMRLFQ